MNKQSYGLTKAQKRIWFNSKLSDKPSANIAMVFELTGELDIWALRKAIENLVNENHILKSTIYSYADHLERIINPTVYGNLDILDLTQSEQKTDIFWLLHNITGLSFNLATGPLFYFHLIKETAGHFYFTILVHPIIVDRYSLKYMIEEISRQYNLIVNKNEIARETLFDFNQMVELEKKFYESEKYQQGLMHWTNTLKANQFYLELPRKGYFASQEYVDSPFYEILLDADLRKKVLDYAELHQVDFSIVLLATYQALLQRYTGNNDIIINYSSSCSCTDEKIFGCLENRLPLRVLLSDHITFHELLKLTQNQLSYDTHYKNIQINDIVKSIRNKYEAKFPGVFTNTSFDSNYLPYEQLQLGSVQVKLIPKFMKKVVPESLALYYRDTGEHISLIADFDEQLDKTAVKNLMYHYQVLLRSCLNEPYTPISKQPLLTQEEYQKIIIDWNKTATDYPHEFIHRLFEKEAAKNPQQIAVVYKNCQLTYAELNERANQLAHYIRRNMSAETKDQLIGICLNRSTEMIISMLAILKAGAGYVPLDPKYPQERLIYILNDTKVKTVISNNEILNSLSFLSDNNRHIICLDNEMNEIKQQFACNIDISLDFNQLAYVIYTSGSTGLPKGVMIEHQSFPNLVYGFNNYFKAIEGKRVLQFASMNFDAAIPEIFCTLTQGATLYVVSDEIRESADKLIEYLDENKITTAILPPVLLKVMPRRPLPFLSTLVFAGDTCDQETLDYWAQGREFVNGYGPTETTVCCTCDFLQPGDLSNRLGKPISNFQTYILDKHSNPVPIGMIGELHIGGIGLARGYMGRPEQTSERFISNFFDAQSSSRLYKTGDLARYLPDGNIVFIGRADFEVKIRGFRIQMSDIEYVMQRLSGLKQITTKLWQKPGLEKVIAAYYVLEEYGSHDESQIREHIQKYLPDYMMPSYFIELDAMPISTNGKINKAQLPDPFPCAGSGEVENHEEQVIKEIWVELFKVSADVVNANSDFFNLGGHSLLATQLASRIKSRLNIDIAIKNIFQHSQLKQLAKLVRELQTRQARQFQLQKAPKEELYHLSLSQMPHWFIFKTNPQSTTYNILFSIVFSSNVDIIALRKALIKVINTEELFRASFVENRGDVRLKIHDKIILDIPIIDCHSKEDIQFHIDTEKKHIFDLSQLPLFRSKLLISENHGTTLLFNIHHIVFDGWSLEVFMNLIGKYYTQIIQNKSIDEMEKQFNFKDFAFSQIMWEKEGLFDQQISYWQRKLIKPLPILELPTDFKRPNIVSYQGDCVRFSLPKNLVLLAKKISSANKCSLFSLLLSAYNVLLHRITHQNDLIVASPIANRSQQELEQLIGLCANVIVYRTQFKENMSFDDLLTIVNEDVLTTHDNQDVPFDIIVNQIQASRDTSRNPVFQTMFVLQNGFKIHNKLPNTDVSYRISEEHTLSSKFDMSLFLYDNGAEDDISGFIEFNKALFREDTISRYVQYYINILRAVTENPQRSIESVPLLSSEEYNTLVHIWNETYNDYPKNTINALFENEVIKTPNHIAVVYNQEKITYGDLNTKANQLANLIRNQYRRLSQQELSKDTIIGLCLDRSIEMIVGILAILKAGAAYLPLDPYYPPDRLNYMLNDSKTKLILSKQYLFDEMSFLSGANRHVICVDTEKIILEKESVTNLNINVMLNDLAYIIYTSGSTGMPKGVMIEHKNVPNLSYACRDMFKLSSQSQVLQFASINFDVAVCEIFETLLNGATLYIVPEEVRKSPDQLIDYMNDNQINFAILPPALLRILPKKELPYLEKLGFAGDICDQETINYWVKNRTFFNAYGPTEVTVYATASELKEGDFVNRIGKPLSNYKAYVLDSNLSPVPVGVLGELYIGGRGLARGYLNRNDLTVERFMVNPFSDNPSDRIYKTGDVVRWRQDGQIEYVGRSDFQVQIRGFRVELGEIEENLSQYPAVKQTAVMAIGDDINKQLVAYYTQQDNFDDVSVENLRKYLQQKLPDYMVPNAFIKIDTMPLSPSGKIDKKNLPKLNEVILVSQNNFIPPRNDIETKLVEIWVDLFNYPKIGVRDNFFTLGGNSLLSIKMLAVVKELFDYDITLSQFFLHPTIEGLSEIISGKSVVKFNMTELAIKDADIQVIQKSINYPETIQNNFILLTGANGFLGVHLLQELISQTNAIIYCLVRGKDDNEIKQKIQSSLQTYGIENLLNNPRIQLINGDLSKPKLGLDKAIWDKLSHDCDVIFHNGSLVNHIYSYEMLKPTNVDSTIELIKLAITGKAKIFNYISTLSAASQFNELGYALEIGPGNNPAFESGYQLSKWVSEKILVNAVEQGVKVNIFRPGNITGHSKTGISNFENNHALLLLKSCVQGGAAPNWQTNLEMTPVDVLSKAIVKLSKQPIEDIHVFNMGNPNNITWEKYFNLVEQSGFDLQTICPKEWRHLHLINMDEDNAFYPLREIYLQNPELCEEGPQFNFENKKSVAQLSQLGIVYPDNYSEIIYFYLDFLKKRKFFDNEAA